MTKFVLGDIDGVRPYCSCCGKEMDEGDRFVEIWSSIRCNYTCICDHCSEKINNLLEVDRVKNKCHTD